MAKTGTVTSPVVQSDIETMLARVAQLPSVAGVTSPYGPAGAKQISANHTIAFATVDFTKDANQIPRSEATNLVNLARSPNSPSLQVDVVGSIAASTSLCASALTSSPARRKSSPVLRRNCLNRSSQLSSLMLPPRAD